ncbi:hypothetical protein [Anabaena sp. FACHB-1237]|nr:hypothetical protein [Anabaena sp. FACHB-1237]
MVYILSIVLNLSGKYWGVTPTINVDSSYIFNSISRERSLNKFA